MYSSKDQLPFASDPADLNKTSTNKPVIIIGTAINTETFSQPKPSNEIMERITMPEINPPTIGGPMVLPICAPVKCIDRAKPFLFGYLAAKVPNAGACQKL